MSQIQKDSNLVPGGSVNTLSAEGGADTPPLGFNFNFSGSLAGGSTANGAILFSTPTDGEMNAAVQVDGTSISINASNQLSALGLWTDVTSGTQAVTSGGKYLSDNAVTVVFTLPVSTTVGDYFRIAGVQGSWSVSQNANQQIKFGSSSTTIGLTGSLASTNSGDCIELVATNTGASSVWRVISSIGNITVT